MTDLIVGDLVMVVRSTEWTNGLTGKIVAVPVAISARYLVEFNARDADGQGHDKHRPSYEPTQHNRWYCRREHLHKCGGPW